MPDGQRSYASLVEELHELKARNRNLEAMLQETKWRENANCARCEEKVGLTRELHHRVKNSLQVVSSIISLQETCILCDDERITFRKSRDRIRAIALAHDIVGSYELPLRISFGTYAEKLISSVGCSYPDHMRRIAFDKSIDRSIEIPLEIAIPLGLILNELLQNVLLHAYPGETQGGVRIVFRADGGGYANLEVSDRGTGVPPYPERDGTGIGFQIIRALTDQIRGRLSIEGGTGEPDTGGTKVSLRFPLT